jgi:NAD(P)-dependent dehydrogenase (short-subunit alcohol dehydrogenase family)
MTATVLEPAMAFVPTRRDPSRIFGRLEVKRLVLCGLALAVGLGGAWYGYDWWTVGRFIESTGDAYVGGDITVVAPKVAGFITEVAVTDNQAVHAGDLLALAPEVLPSIYAATKAFVLIFSQSLQAELGPRGLYIQAVLPAATRTEIWARSGRDVGAIPGMMEVGELIDAALVGFDRREVITIPPLPDAGQWDNFAAARLAMVPNFRQEHPAVRYRAAPATPSAA